MITNPAGTVVDGGIVETRSVALRSTENTTLGHSGNGGCHRNGGNPDVVAKVTSAAITVTLLWAAPNDAFREHEVGGAEEPVMQDCARDLLNRQRTQVINALGGI